MLESAAISKVRRSSREESTIADAFRAALIAAGVIAAIFTAIRMKWNLSPQRWPGRRKVARSQHAERMRHLLVHAIVGNTQHAILSIFGPPRSSAGYSATTPTSSKDAFLRANTWYYLLDAAERRAMVIEFENGIARRAQFLRSMKTR